jgi:hypothetical protein
MSFADSVLRFVTRVPRGIVTYGIVLKEVVPSTIVCLESMEIDRSVCSQPDGHWIVTVTDCD